MKKLTLKERMHVVEESQQNPFIAILTTLLAAVIVFSIICVGVSVFGEDAVSFWQAFQIHWILFVIIMALFMLWLGTDMTKPPLKLILHIAAVLILIASALYLTVKYYISASIPTYAAAVLIALILYFPFEKLWHQLYVFQNALLPIHIHSHSRIIISDILPSYVKARQHIERGVALAFRHNLGAAMMAIVITNSKKLKSKMSEKSLNYILEQIGNVLSEYTRREEYVLIDESSVFVITIFVNNGESLPYVIKRYDELLNEQHFVVAGEEVEVRHKIICSDVFTPESSEDLKLFPNKVVQALYRNLHKHIAKEHL